MDFEETPEEQAFRAEARSWLEARATRRQPGTDPEHFYSASDTSEEADAAHGRAREAWQRARADAGWAGSAGLRTRAVRDGESWIVNGQKVWTSGAHHSDWGLLLARTDLDSPKHKGITAFLLDMRTPGIEVRPLRQINGMAHFNEVFFTDVAIADACRLGPANEGWRVAQTMLANERAMIGSGGRVGWR